MPYKSLMIKIHNPSRGKREIMDGALRRYADALQFLLDFHRQGILELAKAQKPVNRAQLLRLLDREAVAKLNDFAVQPFKDSLKIEFAAMAANFIAQRRRNPNARFPSMTQAKAEEGAHPLYFGRYATNRDYCLLHDRSTGRFYAKLYLLNAEHRIACGETQGRLQLQYVTRGMPDVPRQTGLRRYLVLPLAFGRHQLNDLNRLLQDPTLASTARLKRMKGEYYLYINIACEPAVQHEPETTMGIARSASGGVFYTVCDGKDQVTESGLIDKPQPECQKLFLLAGRILDVCRRFHPQVIVEAGGGRNDKLLLKTAPGETPLTTTEYARLVRILRYKLSEEGLPPPAELSANRLFTVCPACLQANQGNRLSARLFACVECGYAAGVEAAGSLSLVRKLRSYRNNRVPVVLSHSDTGLVFSNRILGFECTLQPDCEDFNQMLYELNLYIHRPLEGKISRQKYAMLKKLQSAPNMEGAIRIIQRAVKS